MPFAADHHMVVDSDAQQATGFGDAVGDLDIGAAGLGGAGGVVVDEDHRCRAKVQRAADHFARVDRGLVDRAFAHHVVEDQHVAGIEIEHAHAFDRQVRHVDGEIVDQRLPRSDHRRLAHFLAGKACGGDGDDLERGNRRLAHAGVPRERARIGLQHGGERAEALEERARQRFHVAPGHRLHQQQFDYLVVGQRLGPAVEQPRAQALTVAGGIVTRFCNTACGNLRRRIALVARGGVRCGHVGEERRIVRHRQ